MMHVGILNAIPPEESKVDWEGSPVDAYIRFFQSADPPFTYQSFEVTAGDLPESVGACDVYVITGSPKGVYDPDPWIGRLAEFLREAYEAQKKLVGICFGHQMLAHALGGFSEKSENGWGLGLKSISLHNTKPWMGDARGECALYFVHQDQVKRLPPGAELLAGNPFCPNAFFVIGNQVLGIQGHPEFSPSVMRQLVADFPTDTDPALAAEAAKSLAAREPDNALLARWIVDFLQADPQPDQ